MQFTMLFLTCAHQDEAQKIGDALLHHKLIACAKTMPVHASFLWQGVLDKAEETILIMETRQELCTAIEEVVREHHSYTTFVLVGMPIMYVSEQAKKWLAETLEHSKI